MKVSAASNTDFQSLLFDDYHDVPLTGHGQVRTLLGKWAEWLTVGLFNGKRHKTDSTCDYCPDVSVSGNFIECKAAGRTNQTFVYRGRLDHDWLFARDHPLFYCIWHHATDTKAHATAFSLCREFIATLRGLIVVPFWAFYSIARRRPCEKLNSKYGSSDSNPTYGAGYRVSFRLLDQWRIAL